MPKLNDQQLLERAKMAAVESAPKNGVGEFLQLIEEDENVFTFLFEAKMKGYVGWAWSVSLFANDEDTTVSEVNLMPGDESLVAPNWVPWAERLADYKALQAELEAQAALEAAENESEESEESDDEDSEEDAANEDSHQDSQEFKAEVSSESNETEESATTLAPEGVDAESDADETSARVPRFLRRRLGRLKHKK